MGRKGKGAGLRWSWGWRGAKEADEVLAHLNSLSKIRNAIAHNTATIPKDYQDELTLFLKKYIKIVNQYNQ